MKEITTTGDKKKVYSAFGRKKEGTVVTNKKGKSVVLLSPAAKTDKAAWELKQNAKYTNEGFFKSYGLTREERSYRSGYISSSMDNVKAFGPNSKKK